MIHSLSLKLAMLAVTMGVVFWVGWQRAEPQRNDPRSMDPPVVSPDSPIGDTPSRMTSAVQSTGGSVAVTPGVSNHVGVAGHAVPRLVDLNSATVGELESLPGIGAVLAQRVIAYRQSAGRFLTVEDLREVKGIGSKKFEQIKPLVTVTVARGGQKGRTEKRTS